MKSATSRVKSFVHLFFSKAGFDSTYTAKNLLASRLRVELLESRVQPSFLTGGLDLGAGLGLGFGDDLLNERRHDNDHLAALASALATPASTRPADGDVTAASNSGGAASPGAQGGRAQVSPTAAELSALGTATRSLGLGAAPAPRQQTHPLPATRMEAPTATLVDTGLAARQSGLKVIPASNAGGQRQIYTIGFTTFQQDFYFAQWNATATGVGTSAGVLFVGGFSTDYTNGFTAATIASYNPDGTPNTAFGGTGLEFLELQSGGSNYYDQVTGLAISGDGNTLYLTANIGVTANASGYTGFLAAVSTATGAIQNTVSFIDMAGNPADTLLNAVADSGSGVSERVSIGGSAADANRPGGMDFFASAFNASNFTPIYISQFVFGAAPGVDTSIRSVAADPTGNLYFGGTLADSATDTAGLFGQLASTGTSIPYSFFWNNIDSGPNGAINGVAYNSGFFYMAGSLNHSGGAYSQHVDMIIAKVDATTGTTTGGWAWEWFNGSDIQTNRSGDLEANAAVVRDGELYVAGLRNHIAPADSDGPPTLSPDGDPYVRRFNATGDDFISNEYGLGGSTYDSAKALSFTDLTSTDVYTAGFATSYDFYSTDGTLVGYGYGPYDAWASQVAL